MKQAEGIGPELALGMPPPSPTDREGSGAMAPLQAPLPLAMIGKKGGGIPGMKQAEGIGPELALGMPPLPTGPEGLLGHGSPSSTSSPGDDWQKGGRYPGDETSHGSPQAPLPLAMIGKKRGRYPGDETSRGDWPRVGSWNDPPSQPDRKGSRAMAPLQAPPPLAMIGKRGGGIPGMKQFEGIGPEPALGMLPPPPYRGGLLGHGSPSSTSSLGDDLWSQVLCMSRENGIDDYDRWWRPIASPPLLPRQDDFPFLCYYPARRRLVQKRLMPLYQT